MKVLVIPDGDGRYVAINPATIVSVDGTDDEYVVEFMSGRTMTCKGKNQSVVAFINDWSEALSSVTLDEGAKT